MTKNALIKRLAYAIAGLGIGMFLLTMAVAALGHEPANNVWTKAGGILAGSVICLILTKRVLAGSKGTYDRLRIISLVACALVAANVALPGVIPVWFRAEQVVHGLLLATLAWALWSPEMRESFRVAAR